MEKKIENAIASVIYELPEENGYWLAYNPDELAEEIAAAIAPLVEAEADWKDAPEWANWRLDYLDGSHNFSKGYPSVITTGVIKITKRL